MKIEYKTITQKIDEWISKNYPNGYEIDTDYNDELRDDQISKLLDKKHPKEAFYDLINELYIETEYDIYQDLWKEFINDNIFTESQKDFLENNEEVLKDYLRDKLLLNYPYDHYLEQTVNCDIVIDNGDQDAEFCRHDCYPNYIANDNIHSNLSRESGMMLIANLQGYSNKQFKNIYRQYALSRMYDKQAKQKQLEEKYPFITSCYNEIWECPTSQSCFVICINISLEDLINWHENKEDVHIPKDIICTGLYNYWSGGGSLLEITLEKNIVIPKEKIAYLLPDEAWHTSQHQGILFGYSIQNCYGLEYDAWLPLNKL